MSNSSRPHGLQPTRPRHPWDSPGKNTGVGCHFHLQCMKVKSESEIVQSCPTLRNPKDCSPPGSYIHGIFQARVLEWGAIAFSTYGGLAYIFKIQNKKLDKDSQLICREEKKHLFLLSPGLNSRNLHSSQNSATYQLWKLGYVILPKFSGSLSVEGDTGIYFLKFWNNSNVKIWYKIIVYLIIFI